MRRQKSEIWNYLQDETRRMSVHGGIKLSALNIQAVKLASMNPPSTSQIAFVTNLPSSLSR